MTQALRSHADKRRRPYWRSEQLLGKTVLAKQNEQVLIIGRDAWTRQQVIDDLHCGHMVAAANLTRVCHKLNVDSLEQLTSQYSPEDLFAETGVGIYTIIVLMCAQEAKKTINPMKWVDKDGDDLVTLSTVKHRVLQEQHKKAAKKNGKKRPN
jgi:alpha-amylase/alpha-mannosidase (GH57 family)